MITKLTNYITTDIPSLDIILSGRGLQLGKMYEIYGEESTSKSTIAQFFMKKFQEQVDGIVLYIDTEQSFDITRYAYMGGNVDNIEVINTIVLEDIFKKIDEVLLKSKTDNRPALIVIDTIASTITQSEQKKGDYSGGIAERPRFLSRIMPAIVEKLKDTKSTLIVVNQVYDNVGSVGKKSKGGRSIRYFSSVRMEVVRIKDKVKKSRDIEIVEGIYVKLTTKKNKLFYPRLNTVLYIHNELGVQEIESLITYLKDANIVSSSGAWSRFKYKDIIDFKFNNAESFKINADKYENTIDIIKYIIYSRYMYISPLVKVKLIDIINNLEEKLGEPQTILTESELLLAQIEEKRLQKESQDE